MPLLLLAALLAQVEEPPPEPGPRSGLEGGVAFLVPDPALGGDDKFVPGFEIAFHMSKPEPTYSLGFRAYYRRFDVTFDEFNQAPADLDGEVQMLGLNLVVTYPITGPLSLGVELGGGGIRFEHDLDDESAFFFEGGAFLRVDLIAGFYVQAGAVALGAFTEFGGQDDDTDHVSYVGRAVFGFDLDF